MSSETVSSRKGVPIRLSQDRWFHITEQHSELAGYYFEVLEAVVGAEAVYQGSAGECLAVREVDPGKYLVVYRELSASDGFVITAFLTRRRARLERRVKLWPQ
ncbi:MAG: hypothetical protein HPY83_02785 [Anaerolineae bacterium]|nr:hypothetical protein [Anaerolineae bacterium]